MVNQIKQKGDFPGGPVVKSPPCNAEVMGLIPGWETKILHAMGRRLRAMTAKPVELNQRGCVLQWKISHDTVKITRAATKTWPKAA